jgi:hypothetical protein
MSCYVCHSAIDGYPHFKPDPKWVGLGTIGNKCPLFHYDEGGVRDATESRNAELVDAAGKQARKDLKKRLAMK